MLRVASSHAHARRGRAFRNVSAVFKQQTNANKAHKSEVVVSVEKSYCSVKNREKTNKLNTLEVAEMYFI